MLLFGIGDMIYKRGGLAAVPPHQLLMVRLWVFLPSVVLFGLFSDSLAFVSATLWGALAGLFMTIGFYNFAHSRKSGSISINAPVFRLNFVITATCAILVLNEPVIPEKIVGSYWRLPRCGCYWRCPHPKANVRARLRSYESCWPLLLSERGT